VTTYWCEWAWLDESGVVDGVLVEIEGTHITRVGRVPTAPDDAHRLAGLTVPGFANCHSHAFHRALRARTQRESGSFWTWRDTMYAVAERLDPDRYYALAKATYDEMAIAGVTVVGEFHYLHHGPGGTRYDEPNAFGLALVSAARDAGLRIALLDACYLSSGFGAAPEGVQARYSDDTAQRWAERVADLARHPGASGPDVVVGAAIHSVRAVPRDDLTIVAAALPDAPLHAHVSEQVAENDGCQAAYGMTPVRLLTEHGAVTDRFSAVHATHLTDDDRTCLGSAAAYACFCPTTERDLGDGIGDAVALVGAGARLTLGSDSHAVIDPFEEMRAVELDQRLASQRRGHLPAADLLRAGTVTGHASLGFADAGRIAAGQWADLVTVALDSPRTAGTGESEETAVFAAGPADVRHVVSGGRPVVLDPDAVGERLGQAINEVVGTR
jgi:formiminoglutamate deiminase